MHMEIFDLDIVQLVYLFAYASKVSFPNLPPSVVCIVSI